MTLGVGNTPHPITEPVMFPLQVVTATPIQLPSSPVISTTERGSSHPILIRFFYPVALSRYFICIYQADRQLRST
jgi:hypothetical protein